MAKSIIQNRTGKLDRECFLCREEAERIGYYGELRHTGLHKHHIMDGTANRKLSEKYGLWVYACNELHHEIGPESPHKNIDVKRHLQRVAQRAFEKIHGHEKWMEVFQRNFLEEEDGNCNKEQSSTEFDTSGFIRLEISDSSDL